MGLVVRQSSVVTVSQPPVVVIVATVATLLVAMVQYICFLFVLNHPSYADVADQG